MWVIKLKNKELYLYNDKGKLPILVEKSKAKPYLTQGAATKSLGTTDRNHYPGYLKDLIGYGVKDFETVELKS